MRSHIAALAALGLAAAAVLPALAQNTAVIAERQQLMKNNGRAARMAGQMLKGESPFDAAKAAEVFQTMHETAVKFPTLFPEDSKTGGDTEASPAIWEKPDEFKAANAKFEADTAAALAANPQTLDAFKAAFGPVGGNCRSCHEQFRVSR